jgi:1,4-dihydroxy-2-naphthoate octaprenyltransferase
MRVDLILVSLLAQTLKSKYCTYIQLVRVRDRFDPAERRNTLSVYIDFWLGITVLAVLLRAALLCTVCSYVVVCISSGSADVVTLC